MDKWPTYTSTHGPHHKWRNLLSSVDIIYVSLKIGSSRTHERPDLSWEYHEFPSFSCKVGAGLWKHADSARRTSWEWRLTKTAVILRSPSSISGRVCFKIRYQKDTCFKAIGLHYQCIMLILILDSIVDIIGMGASVWSFYELTLMMNKSFIWNAEN